MFFGSDYTLKLLIWYYQHYHELTIEMNETSWQVLEYLMSKTSKNVCQQPFYQVLKLYSIPGFWVSGIHSQCPIFALLLESQITGIQMAIE